MMNISSRTKDDDMDGGVCVHYKFIEEDYIICVCVYIDTRRDGLRKCVFFVIAIYSLIVVF